MRGCVFSGSLYYGWFGLFFWSGVCGGSGRVGVIGGNCVGICYLNGSNGISWIWLIGWSGGNGSSSGRSFFCCFKGDYIGFEYFFRGYYRRKYFWVFFIIIFRYLIVWSGGGIGVSRGDRRGNIVDNGRGKGDWRRNYWVFDSIFRIVG